MPESARPVRLTRPFYRRDSVAVARALLGQRLVCVGPEGRLTGLIVETEAYLGECDRAAHSYNGRRTARTETMYADGGAAYVYLNYGIHWLLNVVVAEIDVPQAVLLRAVEPEEGVETMFARRPKARGAWDLCAGPGKLGAAFGIGRAHNGLDLVESDELYIEQARRQTLPSRCIVAGPRIGIGYAGEWAAAPLRFYIAGNRSVSQTPPSRPKAP